MGHRVYISAMQYLEMNPAYNKSFPAVGSWECVSFPPSGVIDHVILNLTREQVRLTPEYMPETGGCPEESNEFRRRTLLP